MVTLTTFLAQGGTGSPPAGGGEIGQVIFGDDRAMIVTAAMFYLVLGHRSGRVKLLQKLGLFSERVAGLPAGPRSRSASSRGALLIAVFGMYWDISTHIDAGRDPGPLANPAHYFILVGLFGDLLRRAASRSSLPTESPGPTARRLPDGLEAPLGGVLILVCAGVRADRLPARRHLAPHLRPGRDAVGPDAPAAVRRRVALDPRRLVLLVEGAAPRGEVRPERASRSRARLAASLLGGALLIGLSTFQGEFDFGVPQFRLVFHPSCSTLAASVALVAARDLGRPRRRARGRPVLHRAPRPAGAARRRRASARRRRTSRSTSPRRCCVEARRAARRPRRAADARRCSPALRDRHGRPRRRVRLVARVDGRSRGPSRMLAEGVICGSSPASPAACIGGSIGRALSSPEHRRRSRVRAVACRGRARRARAVLVYALADHGRRPA